MLGTELGERFPAGVEEDKHRTDVMTGGDDKESVNALLEALGVLLPE